MSPKPPIPTAPLPPTTQQATWGRSSWAQPLERSLLMGAAIGGRRTVVGASTIPTLRRTVALIGVTVTILMRRLTTTPPLALTAGKRVLTARTVRRLPGLVTILTPGRTLEAVRSRHLMEAGALHKRTTRTQARMRRPRKVLVRTPNWAARSVHQRN